MEDNEELMKSIVDLLLKNKERKFEPYDFYNYWIQIAGYAIGDVKTASFLLTFISEVLSSDMKTLSYFV